VTPPPHGPPSYDEVDPFDLPDWLGVDEVTWSALGGILGSHVVPGRLQAEGREAVRCDLLAVDEAYPAPVATDEVRLLAHQAWRHGEVHLFAADRRLAIAVPGTSFTADLVMEALGRLARSVGASPERYSVLLRIGEGGRTPGR
jgi:hypothetical protein